jgi:hypothetical protein
LSVEAAGRLQRLVDLVGQVFGRRGRAEVAGVVGGVPQRGAVADQDGAGTDRLEEGLVVVDGDGVGALDAVEQRAASGDEQSAAVGERTHGHPPGLGAADTLTGQVETPTRDMTLG